VDYAIFLAVSRKTFIANPHSKAVYSSARQLLTSTQKLAKVSFCLNLTFPPTLPAKLSERTPLQLTENVLSSLFNCSQVQTASSEYCLRLLLPPRHGPLNRCLCPRSLVPAELKWDNAEFIQDTFRNVSRFSAAQADKVYIYCARRRSPQDIKLFQFSNQHTEKLAAFVHSGSANLIN
jgi:hypothetical protein